MQTIKATTAVQQKYALESASKTTWEFGKDARISVLKRREIFEGKMPRNRNNFYKFHHSRYFYTTIIHSHWCFPSFIECLAYIINTFIVESWCLYIRHLDPYWFINPCNIMRFWKIFFHYGKKCVFQPLYKATLVHKLLIFLSLSLKSSG